MKILFLRQDIQKLLFHAILILFVHIVPSLLKKPIDFLWAFVDSPYYMRSKNIFKVCAKTIVKVFANITIKLYGKMKYRFSQHINISLKIQFS